MKFPFITKDFGKVPKMEESENLFELYSFGLCKGKPTPKIAGYKVQETLHFRYLKILAMIEELKNYSTTHMLRMYGILPT